MSVVVRTIIHYPAVDAACHQQIPPRSRPWTLMFSHVGLAGIGADQLEAEVSGSKASTGELLGTTVRGFAYPYATQATTARAPRRPRWLS